MHGLRSALPPLTRGDLLRRALAVLLPVAVVVTALLMLVDIEYLVGGFPVCCVTALVLAFAVTPLGSWRVFLPPMAVLLAIVFCSTAIAWGNLDPREAQRPIGLLWLVFGLFWLPHAWFAAFEVWRWRRAAHRVPKAPWRFQVKFVLGTMALLSVLLGVLKSIHGSPRDYLFFAYGSAGLLLLMGLACWRFWVRRCAGVGSRL